jgi:hypothetical protein
MTVRLGSVGLGTGNWSIFARWQQHLAEYLLMAGGLGHQPLAIQVIDDPLSAQGVAVGLHHIHVSSEHYAPLFAEVLGLPGGGHHPRFWIDYAHVASGCDHTCPVVGTLQIRLDGDLARGGAGARRGGSHLGLHGCDQPHQQTQAAKGNPGGRPGRVEAPTQAAALIGKYSNHAQALASPMGFVCNLQIVSLAPLAMSQVRYGQVL